MKKVLCALAAGAMLLLGCTKGLENRVSVLEQKVASLEEIVAAMDLEVDGLSQIVSNLQEKVYVTGVTELKDAAGNVTGYEISFTQGNPVVISNGQTGPQGDKGVAGLTPTIDMFDGEWYWKYEGGDWILDSNGKKIPAVKKLDFEIGADGHLYVTIQDGSKIDLGLVKGADGQNGAPGDKGDQGDAWFDAVTVDEEAGTVTISVKDSEHDIVLPLYQFTFKVTVPENIPPTAGAEIELTYAINEAAAATTVVRAYPSKGLEVVVDRTANKVVVTLGTVAGYVDLYAINNATGDIKAQTVEFAAGELVTVNVKETELVLAPDASGAVEIPVSTACQYDVVVPDWATATVAPASKAVRDEAITVKASAANTTANDFTGYVVLKDKETAAELFKVAVVQKNYYPSLIADEAGEAIQWEESFGLYKGTNESAAKTFKNTFSFELSDDFSKGAYKVKNMFYAESYFDNNGQPVSNKGGEYYADVEGNTLTLYREGAQKSYGFTADVVVSYDASAMTFAMAETSVGYVQGIGSDIRIKGYQAVVYVEAPAAGDSEFVALLGDYKESFADGSYYGSPSKGTLTIAVSDNADYDLKMTFFGGTKAATTVYANVSEDGKTITTVQPSGYTNMGKFYASTLTVDGNVIWGTLKFDYPTISDYSATKLVNWAETLKGEYTESFADGSYYGNPSKGTLTIAVSDNADYDLKMTFFGGTKAATTVYANVSEDGKTITTVQPSGYTNMGKFYASTLTVDGNVIWGTLKFDYPTINDYSATKK